MVTIPTPKDPTLKAMKRAVMNQPLQDRNYVGASAIGDECARKIWYSLHRPPRQSNNIYDIEDGHRTEALIASRLRMVDGIELWTEGDDGKQLGFSDGDFKGHVDGIIKGLLQAPNTPHIWECKCTKKFSEFVKIKQKYGEKNALKKWNMQYYVQAQIYMHYFDIDRHYTTVCSPGGRDIDSCRTEYAADVALQYADRAKKIASATSEPDRQYKSETFYKCRWCDFAEECWK